MRRRRDLWPDKQQEQREGALGGAVSYFQSCGRGRLLCEAETEWGLEGGLGAWGDQCGWSRVGEEESSRTGGRELAGTGCGGLRAHAEGLCSEWSGRWWRVAVGWIVSPRKRHWRPNHWSLWMGQNHAILKNSLYFYYFISGINKSYKEESWSKRPLICFKYWPLIKTQNMFWRLSVENRLLCCFQVQQA